MYLISNDINDLKLWHHDPYLQDFEGYTMAMLFACRK